MQRRKQDLLISRSSAIWAKGFYRNRSFRQDDRRLNLGFREIGKQVTLP